MGLWFRGMGAGCLKQLGKPKGAGGYSANMIQAILEAHGFLNPVPALLTKGLYHADSRWRQVVFLGDADSEGEWQR